MAPWMPLPGEARAMNRVSRVSVRHVWRGRKFLFLFKLPANLRLAAERRHFRFRLCEQFRALAEHGPIPQPAGPAVEPMRLSVRNCLFSSSRHADARHVQKYIQLSSEYWGRLASVQPSALQSQHLSAHDEGLRFGCSFFPNNYESRLKGKQSKELAALQGEGQMGDF
jgi:hypothetical protein